MTLRTAVVQGDAKVPAEPRVAAIAHVIQLAVAPVFLLMGVTAMLGVLMNRLGRIIDRGRRLESLAPDVTTERRTSATTELRLLVRRARLVYWAVSLCTSCALLLCSVIAALFLGAFFEHDLSSAVAWMFIAAMVALFGALVFFLREIYLATSNLRLGGHEQG
jgi:hypothetical protein